MRIDEGTEFLDRLKDTVHEQYFEIERLNNIIKDLEDWLKENEDKINYTEDVIDKIKELKER